MRKSNLLLIILLFVSALGSLGGASFSSVEGKLFNDKAFIFPDDLLEQGPVVVALTLSSSRKNGEEQQGLFIDWQKKLKAAFSPLRSVSIYHVSVIDGAPFFVRGAIRGGIAKEYGDILESSQGGVLFLSKSERWAADAAIPIDGQPTLVVLSENGSILGFVKGEYSEQRAEQLQTLLGL